MKRNATDRANLVRVAKGIKDELSRRIMGRIRLREKLLAKDSYTTGWRIELGSLGQGKPRLELWLDHWTGKRRFWFGFYTAQGDKLDRIIQHLPPYLEPQRLFSDDDMAQIDRATWRLKNTLRTNEFNKPLHEQYSDKSSFYGMFDPSCDLNNRSTRLVIRRASAFFEDVLTHQPRVQERDQNNDVYPRSENRVVVRLHLVRERNSSLAEDRKRLDGYRCQVCGMSFEEVYGRLGQEFAEAHHRVPLSKLKKQVLSSLEELVTVCSNCHRMLHKLEGKAQDVAKLKQMLRRKFLQINGT